jgi:hypothetical protein
MSRTYKLRGDSRTARPARTGFSRRQQSVYRPLVDAAWRVHCRETGRAQLLNSSTTQQIEKDSWYRRQLLDQCGIYSTKEADRVEDFNKLIVHFEALSRTGIFWSLRVVNNDARVARKLLNDYITAGDIDVEYVRGVARQAGASEPLEHITDAAQLLNILQVLKQRIPEAK